MIEKLITWAVPFVMGSIVSVLSTYFKKNKALEKGVQCLLRAEIVSYHERYSKLGSCPYYAKEALRRIYESYHMLDGNDVATGLYEKIISLPETDE